METLKLNETPVRTSRNFNINNIKLEDIQIPHKIEKFHNLEIINETDKIEVNSFIDEYCLTYGNGLENQVRENSNKNLRIAINSKKHKELFLNFKLDNKNINLIDNIQIVASENTNATVYLKYETEQEVKGYHNGIVKVFTKQNSNLNIVLVNLVNSNTDNFISIDNEIAEKSKLNYTIIDFGGKNSITNLYSNLLGKKSENNINTIYLGNGKQLIDINYIGELRGEESNINIEVQGALTDNARKHFKGTIDFKKGCKKSKGNENEFCTILSDTSKSLALPMLLCSEEDVEGNHSSAAGRIENKELFYIMSRGFSIKEAMKLIIRAKFNNILENIKNEELKNLILYEIDERLD